MKRILITGASGYIGTKLTGYFSGKKEIKKIVGIDIKEPADSCDKLVFYKRDIRKSIADVITAHKIDAVIHAAFVLPPSHKKDLMEDININGAKNVFESALSAGAKQILYTSSATAYGFHNDNPVPLTEEDQLRGNDDITYAKSKRIIEELIQKYISENPKTVITVLRPPFVVGPGFDNPLARYLKKKLVPIPPATQPFQFIHEDDLVDIIYDLLSKKKGGIYNVGADGVLSIKEIITMLNNVPVTAPYSLLHLLNNVAWHLRISSLSEFPSSMLKMLTFPWIVSSEKLQKETGFKYAYTSREAFLDYAENISKITKSS